MTTSTKHFLAAAAGFLLLGLLWSQFGQSILFWQASLSSQWRFATAFAVGVFVWHATGFDDAVLFAGNLSAANTASKRALTHLGLYASVLVMAAVTYVGGAVVAEWIRQFRWIIVAALLAVAWNTFPDGHWLKAFVSRLRGNGPDRTETTGEPDGSDRTSGIYARFAANPFVLQFVTFTMSSSDDYVANTAAVMVLSDETSRIALLAGVFFGAVSMAWLVHRYHERIIPHDAPAVRAWIFVAIATVIALS